MQWRERGRPFLQLGRRVADDIALGIGLSFRDIAIDIGLLAGYLVALFLAAHVGFLRYDIH